MSFERKHAVKCARCPGLTVSGDPTYAVRELNRALDWSAGCSDQVHAYQYLQRSMRMLGAELELGLCVDCARSEVDRQSPAPKVPCLTCSVRKEHDDRDREARRAEYEATLAQAVALESSVVPRRRPRRRARLLQAVYDCGGRQCGLCATCARPEEPS